MSPNNQNTQKFSERFFDPYHEPSTIPALWDTTDWVAPRDAKDLSAHNGTAYDTTTGHAYDNHTQDAV
jgi:hypothetical protein